MITDTSPLQVRDLHSGYGEIQVLNGIDLTVPTSGGVAVLGRNGMGKTTLLQTIMGFIPPTSGSVLVGGADVTGKPIHQIARAGLRLVPQGRRVFSSLTVQETLNVSVTGDGGGWNIPRIYDTFPSLAARRRNRSDRLSGGEQEMLAIARALLGNPACLLLDEPSDGLAPKVVDQVREIVVALREEGLAVILVEQNLRLAVASCEQIYCMVRGEMVWQGTVSEFRHSRDVAIEHLGVGAAE